MLFTHLPLSLREGGGGEGFISTEKEKYFGTPPFPESEKESFIL